MALYHLVVYQFYFVFFFQAEDGIRDYKVTGVQTCALPIWPGRRRLAAEPRPGALEGLRRAEGRAHRGVVRCRYRTPRGRCEDLAGRGARHRDRKSTRLNSSHLVISYAVFCLKKKKKNIRKHTLGYPPFTILSISCPDRPTFIDHTSTFALPHLVANRTLHC